MEKPQNTTTGTADETISSDVDNRKKPGRPRKKAPVVSIETRGIIAAPVNEGDIVELVYGNPSLFKKILQMLKAFEVGEIEMCFDPEGLNIYAVDHLNKSNIYVSIAGKYMNLYYCKQPLRICVKRNSMDKVFGSIGQNHYKITFILKEDYRSTMYMIVKDLEYDNDDSYEVDVVFRPENIMPEVQDNDADYPVKFMISSKHFKSRIGSIRKLSGTLTIQKCGDQPLQFTFDKAQRVNWTGVYHDPGKINLQANIPPNDIFNVSVSIDYIKPFSTSIIGDDVYIAADKRKKMSFMTHIDKKENGYAATVKVFTEIKDYGREDA